MLLPLFASLLFLAQGATDSLRGSICLNGLWDVVLNADETSIPKEGWSARRAPAMPLRTIPPAVSAWYRAQFDIPRDWVRQDRKLFLEIEKVGHYASLYVNGRKVGEQFGQYTPFESDITAAVQAGKQNEIAIYVHNASGKYVRAGVGISDERIGNAYRGANDREPQRNWTGITGDITLSWRPAENLSSVFVIPSVRKQQLSANIEVKGGEGLKVRAAVLDGERVVLNMAETAAGKFEASWKDPVPWGPPPYGQPKLYFLRTELLRQGKVVDRVFTRFGFREVWIEGRDVLLNGKKMLMSGTYFPKLAAIRYLNDRRAQASMIALMQASGLNTLHGHSG